MSAAAMIPGLATAGLGMIYGDKANREAIEAYDPMIQSQEQILKNLSEIPLPELQRLMLETPEYLGDVAPEMAGLKYQSAMEGVTTDPRFAQAQLDALSKLGELSEGGMSEADKNALLQLQSQQAQANRGQQQAIQQNMAERGMAGGGQEMAAKLMSQQAGADRSAMLGSQINADASQRALEAMMQAGALGGQMQQADFGRKSDIAKSKDIASQFNAGVMSPAIMRDAQTKQGLEGQRADTRNVEAQYNVGIPQQNFQNQLSKFNPQSQAISSIGTAKYGKGTKQAEGTEAKGEAIAGMASPILSSFLGG